MRIWLHHLYMDMHKIPATQFNVDPGYWHEMVACLSSDLTFHSRPPGTAIPIGGTLVEMRHRKVHTLEDVLTVTSSLLSERRVWLRIRDPTSTRRFLGPGSIRTLQMFSDWMNHMAPIQSIWPALACGFYAAADACAHDQMAQIGGFIQLPNKTICFSERFTPEGFLPIGCGSQPQYATRYCLLRNFGTVGHRETDDSTYPCPTIFIANLQPL